MAFNIFEEIFGPKESYTLETPANRIPGEYLRKLANKYIDKDFLARYVDDEYIRNFNNIKESYLRDALLGAQRTPRGVSSDDFQLGLIHRLNHYKSPRPHQEYSNTGVDFYRLDHPDEIVVPYRKSYNDEQMIDLVVPKKEDMSNIW